MPGIPKDSVVPPGGHHFIQKTENGEVRIEGTSYRDLAAQVLRYRIANRMEPGDPLSEVHAFVCDRYPHFCSETGGPMPTPRTTKGHISTRVLSWLNELWKRQAGKPKMLADDAKARRRAEVCAQCPRNVKWEEGGCAACIASAQQVGYVYRAGRKTGIETSLLACETLSQDNRTAVWSENLPDIHPDDRAKLPAHCWRIKDR